LIVPAESASAFQQLEERRDVLRLQAPGLHVPEAHVVKLVGDERQDALARDLGRVAAIAVAVAELLQFVIQVSHRSSGPSCCCGVCCLSGQCFYPSCRPRPGKNSKGCGTPLPFVPFVCCLPPRHAALASMALPAGRRSIEMSH
jgi:hypothetical protein